MSNRARAHRTALLVATAAAAVVSPDGPPAAVTVAFFVAAGAWALPSPEWVLSRALVVAALLLIPVPLLALIPVDLSGPGLARVSVAIAAAVVLFLRTGAQRGMGGPRTGPGSGVFPAIASVGTVVLANTYLLRGSGGALALMDHDHVYHAAVITSVWSAGSELDVWTQFTDPEIRAVPSAIQWSVAVWVLRIMPDPLAMPVAARLDLLTAIALGGVVLGWLGAVATARPVARNVRTRWPWAVVALGAALLGPALWLRYSGMWPALLSAGYVGLAAACIGEGADRDGGLGAMRRIHWALAAACFILAIQAWPLLAAPAAAAIAVIFWARRGAGVSWRSQVPVLAMLASALVVGLTWPLATTERGVETIGSGPGGLGLPDWRLWFVSIALIAVLTASRGLPQPKAPPASLWSVLVASALVAGSGVALDCAFSATTGQGATYYAGKLALIAVVVAMPASVMWLSTGATASDAGARRWWAGASASLCLAGISVWFPWGSDYFPYGSSGPAPGLPGLQASLVGGSSLVTDRAAQDSAVLSCGIDGVIRWPSDSTRAGRYKYASMWTAATAGRLDASAWAVTKDALPPLGGGVTVDQQLAWFGLGGDAPRTLAWVVPDEDAPALALRVGSLDPPGAVSVKVYGESGFSEEADRCASEGR